MKVWYKFASAYCVTRKRDPNEQWDADDTSCTWTAPGSVYLSQPGSGNPQSRFQSYGFDTDDIPDDTLAPADIVYLVWVQYSTGDSFGHQAGSTMEVIGWYRDETLAHRAAEAVRKGPPPPASYDEGVVLVPTYDGSGTRPQSCAGWTGCFESLDHCEVSPMLVEAVYRENA